MTMVIFWLMIAEMIPGLVSVFDHRSCCWWRRTRTDSAAAEHRFGFGFGLYQVCLAYKQSGGARLNSTVIKTPKMIRTRSLLSPALKPRQLSRTTAPLIISSRYYNTSQNQNQHQNQDKSKKSDYGFRNGFKEVISDINLKWTAPIGLILSIGVWFYVQDQVKSNPTTPHLKITEPLPPTIILNQPTKDLIIDPATQLEIPVELNPDHITLNESLRLVGSGVRTVSFLNVKVYVAGFYADPRVLRALRVVPGWNDDDLTKEKFLSSANKTHDDDDIIGGEALIRNLLAAPAHFAIRIDLRDGFCRSLLSRIKKASQTGTISEIDLEKATESINTFRGFFPTGVSVPKGKSLTLIRTSSQTLVIEYDGKKLGELDDKIVARELFLAYFADQDPISIKLKESVAEGFSDLYKATATTSS
ncbi:hypothetical protein MJO28_000302 [Puccinia striiformis f. sp. tritici]|uniref:Uncharacterized protein n=1 Tax=Puccinia striiformis f. sp. tritici TaxID=168172 RepID=A0ACC0EZE8_9BASI|nr:hypothetical protein MJO28_000302 [Puccinia striiformis f. sp. tritici]